MEEDEILGIVDSLDSVPEEYRQHYKVNADGKYVANVTNLTKALDRQKEQANSFKEQRATAEAELKTLQSEFAKIDMGKYTALLELEQSMAADKAKLDLAAKNAANEEARKKGDWDKVEQSIRDTHKDEMSKKDNAFTELNSRLDSLYFEKAKADTRVELSSLYTEHGIDKPYLVEHAIQSRLKTVKHEDGTIKTIVLDSAGKPMEAKLEDGKSIPYSKNDLVKEFASDPKWAVALKANQMAGPDSSGSNRPSDGKQTTITQQELIDLRKASPDAYSAKVADIQAGKVKTID